METKEIQQNIHTERLIGKKGDKNSGACCLFFGGVHGNEPSGVIALHEVFNELNNNPIRFYGSIYGISGNINALAEGKRYHHSDLNRLWTEKRMKAVEAGQYSPANKDEEELIAIYDQIEEILAKEEGPFYFFDLHTTSSKTAPFITVNDSLLNRRFTSLYPLPSILGIEEYLDGPMLSYYNEKGFVSFGFEGGEHYHQEAIENHKAFIYLSLVYTGLIDQDDIDYQIYFDRLALKTNQMFHFYEIYERFEIKEADQFKMKEGFENFQKVNSGEHIAVFNGEEIIMKENSRIFMPLYQTSGNDGYFLIKKTPEIFLKLSAFIRIMKLDRILPILPGVVWVDKRKGKMLVDLKIARFLAKPLLHLMGYRAKQLNEDALIIKNREASSRKKDYINEDWY